MTATLPRENPREHVQLHVQISHEQAEFLRERADETYSSVSAETRRLINAAMRAEGDRIAA